jgi:hypothetical protein
MATAAANISVWVGDPLPAEGDAAWCPNCLVSSVIQVPYYSHIAGADVGEIVLNGLYIACYRRFACNNGCGYRHDDPV